MTGDARFILQTRIVQNLTFLFRRIGSILPLPGVQDHEVSGTIGSVPPSELRADDGYAALGPDDAAGYEPAGDDDGRPPVYAPVRRLVSLGVVGLTALLTLALFVGVQFDHQAFALVVFGVQVLFVIAWTVSAQPPAPKVVATVGLLVAFGADWFALVEQPASLGPMAYVTAGGFGLAVIGQLLRPAGRVRVTESLGSSLMVVLGVVAYATLIVLCRVPLGTQVIGACVVGAGAALLVAHLTDLAWPVMRVAPAVPRGGIGIIVGAMVGTGVAGLTGYLLDGLQTLPTAFAGLAAAVIALMIDLSVNYADAGRRLAGAIPSWWLIRHMQGPLTAFALAAPVAYVAKLILA